jgi:phage/plasmid-associated DNA primase
MGDLLKLLRSSTSDECNYRITVDGEIFYAYTDYDTLFGYLKDVDGDVVVEEHLTKGRSHPYICIDISEDTYDEFLNKELAMICQNAISMMVQLPPEDELLECVSIQKDTCIWIHFIRFVVNHSTLINKIVPAIRSLVNVKYDYKILCPSFVPMPMSMFANHVDIHPYSSEGEIQVINMMDWLGFPDGRIGGVDRLDEEDAVRLLADRLSIFNKGTLYPASKKSIESLTNDKNTVTKEEFKKAVKTNGAVAAIDDKVSEPIEDPAEILPGLFYLFKFERIRNEVTWREIGEAIRATFDDNSEDATDKRIEERSQREDSDRRDEVSDRRDEVSNRLAKGLKLWKECTKRLEQSNVDANKMLYSERIKAADRLWDTFGIISEYDDIASHPSIRFSFSTLKFWAMMDDPKGYDAFTKDTLDQWMYRSLNVNAADTEIADVMMFKYGMKYKVSSMEPKVVWYEFRHHRWVAVQKGATLRKKLSKELAPMYENLEKDISKKLAEMIRKSKEDPSNIDLAIAVKRGEQVLAKCGVVLKSLKKPSSKNTLLTELAESLYDEHFNEAKDENPYLICHKNGVYDLKKMHLRDGRPSDCITLSTNINFRKPDSRAVKMVHDYMAQVFVDKSLRKYTWVVISSFLEGFNFMKALYVLIGSGNNSKSAFISLLERALGEYVFKLPIGLLTNDSNNVEGPSPALARGKGRRVAVFDELNRDGRLKDGPTKRITGNTDKQLCRNLYEPPFEYRPQFKSLLITNNRIQATPDQPALLQRINEIAFESKFSNVCPVDLESQISNKHFPIDIMFDKKFPQMAEAFLWELTEVMYREFKLHGIVEPEYVIEHRDKMRAMCDIYEQFINECMKENQGNKLSCREAYDFFKEWHKEEFGKHEPPTRQDFIEMINQRIDQEPRGTTKSWYNIDLRGRSLGKRLLNDS